MEQSPNALAAASGAQGGICLILLDLDLVSLSPEAPRVHQAVKTLDVTTSQGTSRTSCPRQPSLSPASPILKTEQGAEATFPQQQCTSIFLDLCKENVVYPHLLHDRSSRSGSQTGCDTSCSSALQEELFKEQ